MSWFKENKFLAGVVVVTLLGAGGLGYMLFTAKAKYDESSNNFEQQAAELNRLEHLPAYPDQQNLDLLEAQRVHYLDLIADLQKNLADAVLPVEMISPNEFQERLRAAVTVVTGQSDKMALAKGFYLGFEPYQTALPNPEAAPLLGRELKAVQLIMQAMLDKHVSSLTLFNRDPLPEEANKPKTEPAKTPGKPGPGSKAPPAEPLVKPHGIDMVFVTEPEGLEGVLNALVSNKQQFFIPRFITIRNQVQTGPSKEDTSAAATAPPGPNDKPKSPLIVGEEKVEVTLRVEMVEFAKPAPVATPSPRNRNAGK